MTYLDQLNELLKRFTQTEVSDLLGVTDRALQFWIAEENPKTPHPKKQRTIAELYQSLIVEGKKIEDLKGGGTTNTEIEKRRISKTIPSPYLVPFLPIKAQAGYVKAIDQEVYLDTLEKYALPPGVDPTGTIWRYWEVEGDSMEPTFKQGDIVLTSFVHHLDWENLRNFYTYVIVTQDRVLIKRVYCKNAVEWVLISDNEDQYAQQLLPIEEIKEVWVYRKTWSTRAAPPKVFEIKV